MVHQEVFANFTETPNGDLCRFHVTSPGREVRYRYTRWPMDAAETIRDAVSQVATLRQDAARSPELHAALLSVKSLQAQRFAGTYTDLLASTEFGEAARFFLEDLYSDKDYSLRDAQFARIAGALQRLFPKQVVATAVTLAQLHVLTEMLDCQMALAWKDTDSDEDSAEKYVACWHAVGRHSDRKRQLEMVLKVGGELDRLTRTPGLRIMLRMMRRPATAAGLGSLQTFLESGFDIFAHMSGKGTRAGEFLLTIQERESVWIERLSSSSLTSCDSDLRNCLNQAQ